MTTQHTTDIARALSFTPILVRVHGAHHPELTQVHDLTQSIADTLDPEQITALFAQLRRVTGDYEVPADGCEAFAATYQALRKADESHAAH